MTDTQSDQHTNHPGVGQYVEIGIILAVITALEVALYYVDISSAVTVPALIFLTVLKFALVVLWFMHLRFDSAWFRRVFLFGLGLAIAVFSATIVLQFAGVETP